MYYKGIATSINKRLGFDYINRSANNRFKHALFQLALFAKARKDDEQYNYYLLEAAKEKQIVTQALFIIFTNIKITYPKLSISEHQQIVNCFWEQENEEIFSIPNEYLKWIVIDTYITSNDLTVDKKYKVIQLLSEYSKQYNSHQAYGRLGVLYKLGWIVEKNDAKAEQYWQQAAALGDRNSICVLGYHYEDRGKHNVEDYKQAFIYHEKAVEKGSANSANQLAILYKNGYGVEKNINKAVHYFSHAMKLDSNDRRHEQQDGLFYAPIFPHSAYNLGLLYWHGDTGLPSNKSLAFTYFKTAAEAGHQEAKGLFEKLAKDPVAKEEVERINDQHVYFWKKIQLDLPHTRQLLNKISCLLLSSAVIWKITKKDEAWCFISSYDFLKLSSNAIKPFTLKKTVQGEYILLLNSLSTYNLENILCELNNCALSCSPRELRK